ncbi:endophilin-A-like isoform X2 [Symsagittifera roscoffensis]|uniref:endophilin-A-like isoform X2 n=1 Tax=Symsagittifera roscoffensis TaxID=84072 RepID=UPI00307B1840
MSLMGLAKQYNKVNQYMSEKIWNVEGTKHEEEFNDNEKLTQALAGFIHDVQGKTIEMIQPNPTMRASATVKTLTSKVQGKQTKSGKYQQTEQEFADVLELYSKELEPHPGNLATTLRNLAEGYAQMAEIKDNLDTGVQQTFLEPLACLENKEIKSILANLKKLESRRLDYDCKKRQREKGKQISEAEMSISEDKFNESKQSCDAAMRSLINSDVEVLATLKSLVDLQIDYFSSSLTQLRKIQTTLQSSIDEAKIQSANRPKVSSGSLSGGTTPPTAAPRKAASVASTPSAEVPFGGGPPSFTNGGGSSAGDFGFGTNNSSSSGFKLQPPTSLANSSSLSTSTPSDLNQFGTSSNLTPRNPDLASSSSMLNGARNGPHAPVSQDPWELPSNSTPTPAQSADHWSASGIGQNSSGAAGAHFGSDFGGSSNPSSGSSLYPSLNPPQPVKPPPVAPRPANLGPAPSLPSVPRRPHCIATFDFDAESPEELGFKEGQKIMLTRKVDDNWLEGRLDGNPRVGRFPVSFVQVVVPL